MSENREQDGDVQATAADDIVASADSGARQPTGLTLRTLLGVAIGWSLFQLWVASPLPFIFSEWTGLQLTLPDVKVRSIHLAIAVFLGFLAFPALKRSPRDRVPALDWVWALGGAFCAAYLFLFYLEISRRIGAPTTTDIVVAIIGMVLLLEATRRSLGPALSIVAGVFLLYNFFGDLAPDVIGHGGFSLGSVANHQWITTSGVYGVALGVSAKYVFLFVLFGALLETAGAGNYFIKVAFSLLGHMRGGPAKAAVVASGMTGLISGSSIANVVTTGTFTIPLMKRVGFSAEKAGAVEVASSTNGQLTPPVMGAAAFLMVEFVGITYLEVIKHAFVPALISYIALVYIVHLEAVKANMQGLERPGTPLPPKLAWTGFLLTVSSILIVAGVILYSFELARMLTTPGGNLTAFGIVLGVEAALLFVVRQVLTGRGALWLLSMGAVVICNVVLVSLLSFHFVAYLKEILAPGTTPWVMTLVIGAVYVALVWFGSKHPDLELDDPESEDVILPEVGPTVKTGLYYLLPVVVLVWCLMVERISPGQSAFWATMLMVFIMLTQRPLVSFFRGESNLGIRFREGFDELVKGLIGGARNMIGIGIATAAAGIIVGVVSQTGVGSKLAAVVEILSFGYIFLILFWTAILCLVLGMGLPTTATYIVVSALLAPVIVELGQANGLLVPLIAVHLFVFYFGILADDTPPVGLAAFAAAAISHGDPIKTGIQGFTYDIRTAILPFLFVFNTDLLLIDVGPVQAVVVFVMATGAMLTFAAATQGYFIAKSRFYETLALLLISFSLFRPGFWMDMVVEPYDERPGSSLIEAVAGVEPGTELRMKILGVDDIGEPRNMTLLLTIGEEGTGEERLAATGLTAVERDGRMIVDDAAYDSQAQNGGFDWDQEIQAVLVPVEQPAKEWMYIPAVLLLLLIAMMQRRRNPPETVAPQPAV